MATRFTDRLPFLALLAATCAFLYFRFERLFKCPSCYLFSNGGDGLKNYFTAAYYVRDDGLWFHGMNYPYGEHPVYTDNQPIWSLLMKLINLFHPMEKHVIGTMNMLLVISIAVAVIAMYCLLREFNLPKWYAALVSLPIIFLSPQLERFNGHYSLAYVCYLPLFLLLFVRWQKDDKTSKNVLSNSPPAPSTNSGRALKGAEISDNTPFPRAPKLLSGLRPPKATSPTDGGDAGAGVMRYMKRVFRGLRNIFDYRSLGLLVFIVCIGFTHLYFFFIAVSFMMAYFVVLWARGRFRWRHKLSRILLLVLVTGVALYLPVKLTDPIKDRPQEVYGMYVFAATPAGTILPWYGTWTKTWTEKYNINAPDFESHSYLGIAGVLLAPFILIFAIRTLVSRRRREKALEVDDTSPGVLAWTVFLVWVMATGWFYMAGGGLLVKIFPVIGQFRSLGRLAWIFYYGYSCFAVWFVFTGIAGLQKRWLKFSCIGLAALLYVTWAYEAYAYSDEMTKPIYHRNTIFRGDKPFLDVLTQNNMIPDDFQAILQLPMIIVGTENLPVHRGHWEFNNTLQCAWETGLPIVNYNMSRTSVSAALSLLQLISTPDIPKVRLADMNQKPLLLMAHSEQLLPTERRLIGLADPLGMVGSMGIHKLDIKDFNNPIAANDMDWEVLLHEGFEDTSSLHAFAGSGALRTEKDAVFLTFTDTSNVGTILRYSCWVYLAADISGFPAFQINQYGPDGAQLDEQVVSIHSFDPWQVRGNWVEVTFPLRSKVQGARYDFSVLSSGGVVDEVVIEKFRE